MDRLRLPRRPSSTSPHRTPRPARTATLALLAAAAVLLSAGLAPTARATTAPAATAPATTAPTAAPAKPAAPRAPRPAAPVHCAGTVTAEVVALDSPIYANRIGAQIPDGMIFALAGDVESTTPGVTDWTQWKAGEVKLKDYKRARPLVLRVDRGQCLEVAFRNLVAATVPTTQPTQPSTRATSLHMQGLEWDRSAIDDGSWVGANETSLAQPGGPVVHYSLHAPEEGEFLLYSTGDTFTAPANGDGGTLQFGLFGAVIVEPETAQWFRSQVDHEDLCLASKGHTWKDGHCTRARPDSLPQLDYEARYPAGHPRAGLPILAMLDGHQIVHSDLTAIIAGPLHGPAPGRFPARLAGTPGFHQIAVSPDRLQPFREFVIIYHEMLNTVQAFSSLYAASQLNQALESVSDTFAINYGMGGIGSEILANRFDVGPAANCTDCKYEEFFLSSWPNGDPAMIVDHPSQEGCAISGTNQNDYTKFSCPPPGSQVKATQAFYPDDPSNVYHAYLRDHTKFRILHGGSDLHHLHHLHAHQWLHSPNSSSGHYLDSQAIGPGSGFTLETVYDGAGNKNLTVGDSIFHCHFYPHFAAGMWGLWRVHDVFEDGTALDSYPAGKPLPNSRALPDGEIAAGTPTPAVVPLPGRPMAPEPAPVRLVDNGKEVEVCTDSTYTHCISAVSGTTAEARFKNPGYPFFIPGIAGTRAPHPPLGFALACSVSGEPCTHWHDRCAGAAGICEAEDGGLPRHLVEPGGEAVASPLNPLDFSKEVTKAAGIELPETGTAVEKVAMAYHATHAHLTRTPEGQAGYFRTNGQPAKPGAPYADPCVDLSGNVPRGMGLRRYFGVDFQTDAVFNKEGWHYPQQRMTALWGDLYDYMGLRPNGERRPPEPFFFRANSNDCIDYVLANLVPKTYELDDFQVRTPTDILGQHIHLVKFDVTSSDGSANGWNYEAGTLAPDEVVERIDAFNKGSFHRAGEPAGAPSRPLTPKYIRFFGADPDCASGGAANDERCQCSLSEAHHDVVGGRWCGAQATVERWYVDPTLNDAGDDGTLRTVFTHDHFGPSTHQQIGLYAALVAEPTGSTWHNNETGSLLGNRAATQNGVTIKDGGPTSWESVVAGMRRDTSFREFLFAFQDSVLTYRPYPAKLTAGTAAAGGTAGGCPSGVACGFCSTDHSVACVTEPSSPLYYRTKCPSIQLPIPNVTSTATLEPSCNYVPGIPANDNLFYAVASGANTFGNIWNVGPTDPKLAELRKIGWDGTLPIDPNPKGIVVPQGGVAAGDAASVSPLSATAAKASANIDNKVITASADIQAELAQVLGSQKKPSQPELITLNSATQNFSVNYRNEPLYPRIQGSGQGADLSHVYQSLPRDLPGAVPPPYPPLTPGVEPGDPFTPLLRTYSGDNIEVRMVVGAHQNPHNFHLNDGRWLFEPSNVNSGWRASETMGISEHFEFLMRVPQDYTEPRTTAASQATTAPTHPWTDFLYRPTSAKLGQTSGSWGILRAYHERLDDLYPVPGSAPPAARGAKEPIAVCPKALMDAALHSDDCKGDDGKGHQLRCYGVVATTVQDIFGNVPLTYNTKLAWTSPNGILFLNQDDYVVLKNNQKPGAQKQAVRGYDQDKGLAEPLVLRANAGDCIRVTLHNHLAADQLGTGFNSSQLPVNGVSPNSRNIFIGSNTSSDVGLHAQLVTYDAAHSDGTNVGFNPEQTAAPGKSVTYFWYAGAIDPKAVEPHIPIELGAANLLPSDVVNHHPYGMFGALVIEPERAAWKIDDGSNTSATITVGKRHFREFVLEAQDDTVIQATANGTTTRQNGFAAFNLRSEPLANATGSTPQNTRTCTDPNDVSCVLSNMALCNSSTPNCGFPPVTNPPAIPIQTPLFCARRGDEVRFRLLHPGGAVTNEVFELYGHTFAEEPYVTRHGHCQAPTTHTNLYASQLINPDHNECPDGNLVPGPSLTEWKGSRMGLGPLNHFDVVVPSAGGSHQVVGDYLYRSFPAIRFGGGIWGIFRVTNGEPTANVCPTFEKPAVPTLTSSLFAPAASEEAQASPATPAGLAAPAPGTNDPR